MGDYGLTPADDDEERKRRELEDWIAQQAAQSPDYLRKPPDMTFGLEEAERGPAPKPPAELEQYLAEQAARNPQYMQKPPDMTIGQDEAQSAPDMQFGLDEAAGKPRQYEPPFRPDMSFTPEEAQNYPDMSFTEQEAANYPRPPERKAKLDVLIGGARDIRPMGAPVPNEQPDPQAERDNQEMLAELEEPEQPEQPAAFDTGPPPEPEQAPPPEQPSAAAAPPPAGVGAAQAQALALAQTQTQSQQPAAGGAQFPQGDLSSLIRPPDKDMAARWRTAEGSALDRSGFGQNKPYGIGEGLRDFAPMAAAGVLDALINKGKGLGYIGVAGAQANADAQKNRDARAQQAGEFALNARHQRESYANPELEAAYKQAQIANWQDQSRRGWGNLGARLDQVGISKLKLMYDQDPTTPQAKQIRAYLLEQTGTDIGELGAVNAGRMTPIAGRAEDVANAGPKAANAEQAIIDTRTANLEALAAAERRKREQGARGKKEGENVAVTEGGQPILPPGVNDASPYYAEIAKTDPKLAQTIAQTDQDMQTLISSQYNLWQLRQQIDALPWDRRTMHDAEFAKLMGKWDAEESNYQANKFKAEARGAPQVYEDKVFQLRVGRPKALEDAPGAPWETVKSAIADQAAMMEGQHEQMLQRQTQLRQKYGFKPPTSPPPAQRTPEQSVVGPAVKPPVEGAPPPPAAEAAQSATGFPIPPAGATQEQRGQYVRDNYMYTITKPGMPTLHKKLTNAEVDALRKQKGVSVY